VFRYEIHHAIQVMEVTPFLAGHMRDSSVQMSPPTSTIALRLAFPLHLQGTVISPVSR
jgi:hypothetical protein